MKLTTIIQTLGLCAFMLFYTMNTFANVDLKKSRLVSESESESAIQIKLKNTEFSPLIPIICEFDDTKKICHALPPEPYCFHLDKCAQPPKKVCQSKEDEPFDREICPIQREPIEFSQN
ncbi:MAG: hypothetical protein ABL927_15500 [Bdellovibrionales bacterium]